jgi:hypothetical protein
MLGSITLSGFHPYKVLLLGTFVIVHVTLKYKCAMEQHFFSDEFGKSTGP